LAERHWVLYFFEPLDTDPGKFSHPKKVVVLVDWLMEKYFIVEVKLNVFSVKILREELL